MGLTIPSDVDENEEAAIPPAVETKQEAPTFNIPESVKATEQAAATHGEAGVDATKSPKRSREEDAETDAVSGASPSTLLRKSCRLRCPT
jgi:hypothetical protein